MRSFYGYFSIFLAAVVVFTACKKQETLLPPPAAEFTAANTTATYYIQNSASSVYKIPVGVTAASDKDRIINYSVTSPTGATAGAQYIVAGNSVTIPAGKVVDSITVKGLFAGFSTGRRDTLIFTLTGGDVGPAGYNNVFTLVLQKSCDVVAANLIGSYGNSTDVYNGSPSTKPNYTATISNWTPVSSTSATIVIKNIGATSDNGWGPFASTDGALNPGLTATLDWSNPSNFTVTIASQNYFNDGSGNSTVSGSGTFSSCDNSFTIVCTVKYAGNGNSYTHTSVLKK